ncbi:MAG: sigma-70 region 4 domain-containing protein, partial [Pseudomonadales bacterium]|nr:sigma-70 region 4 domain-containing protein [Pseudomonadales bacterium]
FRTFLRLPEVQRCAVILKDVLGHTVEDIAEIPDCTPVAAKIRPPTWPGRVARACRVAGRYARPSDERCRPSEDGALR